MSIQDPGYRPTEWGVAGDHERRIRALEGLQQCCGNSGDSFQAYIDCVLAEPALAAYWPAQEASGDLEDTVGGLLFVPDTSVVTATTYPLYQQAGPFDDYAVAFAGAAGAGGNDDRFDLSTPSGLFNGVFKDDHAFTIDMLIYPLNNQAGRLFELWGGTLGQWIFIDRDSSGRISFTRTNGGNAAAAATTATALAWTAVRCSHDGTNTKVYINTVEAATSTSSTTDLASNGNAAIGNNRNTGGTGWLPFNGRIAHVALYSSALTEFCDILTPSGPRPSTAAPLGAVLTADGSGGTYWDYPTIEVLEDGV